MGLHWNVSKVANRDDLFEERDGGRFMKPISEAIIWATMVYDLGEITKKNVDEWLFRSHAAARIGWFGLHEEAGKRRPFTRAEIERHIGLHVNVRSTTRASWLKRATTVLAEETTADIRRQEETNNGR